MERGCAYPLMTHDAEWVHKQSHDVVRLYINSHVTHR